MRILVFQHVDVEHPGIFREFWAEQGHEWVPVELDAGEAIPSFDGFDLLAVFGGPMDVWQEATHPWLVAEKAAIRRWVMELKRPYLGICLGHQLLGAALGGTVGPMKTPEVGLTTVGLTDAGRADPIFAGLGPTVECLQWHGAEISKPPQGAEILGANAACATQAIRWGRHAYGFQYHLEVMDTTVADWAAIPEYKESLERAMGASAAATLDEAMASRLADFRAAAMKLNDNLAAIVASA